MKNLILSVLLAGVASPVGAAPVGNWAHVGNTYNSAIFVDRAVLRTAGAERPFRTLHINTQTDKGWWAAEHRGTIDCAARTLRYHGVVITKADGQRETLPSAIAKPRPFPPKGVMHKFATSVCANKLGPAVGSPESWTRKNFRPG